MDADQPGPDQRLHRHGAQRRTRCCVSCRRPRRRRRRRLHRLRRRPVFVSPNAVTSNTPDLDPRRQGRRCRPGRSRQFAVDRSDWRVAYAAYAGFNGARRRPGRVTSSRTSDGGKTWNDVSGNLPDTPVNSIILDPSSTKTLYAGTDVGTFVTTDGGQHWTEPLSTGLPAVSVWQLSFDPSHRALAAGTHGRGAFTASDPPQRRACGVHIGQRSPGRPGQQHRLHHQGTATSATPNATGVSVSDPLPDHTTSSRPATAAP